MQINEIEHHKHAWIAHGLLPDFEVEDVWRFPVVLDAHHDLLLFQQEMMGALGALEQKGPAGFLFKIRFFLGRIFSWDEEPRTHPLLRATSLRERYADTYQLQAEELPNPGSDEFIPVYQRENESLAEIENATVHAGLHLGRVQLGEGKFTIQMAVYVKPKGALGRFYMALIKPFRLGIVYPALMRMVGKRWGKFVKNEPRIRNENPL